MRIKKNTLLSKKVPIKRKLIGRAVRYSLKMKPSIMAPDPITYNGKEMKTIFALLDDSDAIR